MENDILETSKLYGPAFYMFMGLVFMCFGALAFALKTLYSDLKEVQKELKESNIVTTELSRETLGSLKDVMNVLQVIREHNPNVIHIVEAAESNLGRKIDKVDDKIDRR